MEKKTINIAKGLYKDKQFWDDFSERFCLSLTIMLWLIYEIIMFYFFSRTGALVPDEIHFYSIAESMRTYDFKEIISMPNKLGYGSIYWIILILLGSIGKIRFFSFICLSILPVLVFVLQKKVFGRNNRTTLMSVVVLLSCPMTWFTGKMIGPELMGNAFGVIGISLILLFAKQKNSSENSKGRYLIDFFGFAVIGISAGIKLYNVIFAVFIGLYELYPLIYGFTSKIRGTVIRIIFMSVGFVAGFILANPILIINTNVYIENQAVNRGFSLKNIYNILFMHRIEWDLVYSGGINHGIISVVCLCALFFTALLNSKERRLVLSLLVSVLGLVAIVSLNSGFYCWYFLPMLLFVPLLCISSKNIYLYVWGGILIINFC